MLTAVTCAPITRTVRGIRSEVGVGPPEGLPEPSVISCDTLFTVPKRALDHEAIGRLGTEARVELDRALRFALDILY